MVEESSKRRTDDRQAGEGAILFGNVAADALAAPSRDNDGGNRTAHGMLRLQTSSSL
jgi:hypothetical protein